MQKSLKELVLESTDLVDVVGERVALTRKGKDFVGLCPFHNDHKPSFAVSPAKQIFKCWSCGAGGDVIKFVQLSHRVDFREALSILAQKAGIQPEHGATFDNRPAADREALRRVVAWARTHFQRNLHEPSRGGGALAYARGRGFSDETIRTFSLGFAPVDWDHLLAAARRAGVSPELLHTAGLVATSEGDRTYDRFRNRLIFPICDIQGRPIAFGGRTLGDDNAKYLNSPETPLFSKSRVLFALDLARQAIQSSRQAIVVEGYVDAAMLHQAGFTNAVATLGTAMTDAHAKLLAPYADSIVMCFDGDAAGLKAADRAVEVALRHRIDVRVAVMPDGLDPADCIISRGPDALKSMLQSALGALEFRWNRTVAAYGGGRPEARRDALEAFIGFVAQASRYGGIDPLEQGLLAGRLSDLLSVPTGVVYELLNRARASGLQPRTVVGGSATEQSVYDEAIRGLPGGLVASVEELFGVVLSSLSYWEGLDECLESAASHCETWERFLSILRRNADADGVVDREGILAACDDAGLCELFGRCTSRIAGRDCQPDEVRRAAQARLMSELDLMRWGELRTRSRQAGTSEDERERAFRSLLDVSSRRHGRNGDADTAPVLGAVQRLGGRA